MPKPTGDDFGFDLERERQAVSRSFQQGSLSTAQDIRLAESKEDQVDLAYENEKLSLDNRKEKRALRMRWNRILTWLVILGFFLSYGLIILIGLDVLNFDGHAFAVPSVVAAGIVETYGLAKLAIKYFFSEDGSHDDKQPPEIV